MKKSIFAVCDLEASYAYNLMEAIDETQGSSFEVQAFTNVERLIAYAGSFQREKRKKNSPNIPAFINIRLPIS